MDAIANTSNLNEFQIAQVNSVRLWIRTLSVGYISDAAGRNIETWARSGTKRLKSKLDWPLQEKPSSVALMIWRKCLRRAFSPTSHQNLALTRALLLRTKLGRWTSISHVKYDAYWDEVGRGLEQDSDVKLD